MRAHELWETLRNTKDILDIGTSMRFAKELRRYEPLFAGMNYIAAGYWPSMTTGACNCDCRQDIRQMTFSGNSFGVVLCLQVLEHDADPGCRSTVEEYYSVPFHGLPVG